MHLTSDLGSKVAVVTGAGSGIGQSIALALARHGASVVVADISFERALATVAAIERRDDAAPASTSPSALAVGADVRSPRDVDQLAITAVNRYGAVDVLVNNAGGSVSTQRGQSPLAAWHETMQLTAASVFLCSRTFGKLMLEQRHGKVVNIASVYAYVGRRSQLRGLFSTDEHVAYSAAKGAVVSMTRAFAAEWADQGLKVNAIAPGHVRTRSARAAIDAQAWAQMSSLTPLGRFGQPDDIAGAAVYLSSAASDYVTGQVLVVDGGWLTW